MTTTKAPPASHSTRRLALGAPAKPALRAPTSKTCATRGPASTVGSTARPSPARPSPASPARPSPAAGRAPSSAGALFARPWAAPLPPFTRARPQATRASPRSDTGFGRVFEGLGTASDGLTNMFAGVTEVAAAAASAVGLPVVALGAERCSAPTLEEQRSLRALVRDVLEAVDTPAGAPGALDRGRVPARAAALRAALARHPIVFAWILQRRNIDLLWKSSDLPPLPGSSKLAWLANLSGALAPLEDRTFGRTSAGPASEMFREALRRLPDAVLDLVANEIQSAYAHADLTGHNPLERLKDPGVGLRVENMPDSVREVVDRILGRYIAELPAPTRRAIFLSLLELPPRAGVEDTLPAILEHLGPGILKLFQLIGRNVDSPVIDAVMQGLQDRVHPFDGEEAKAEVERALGRPIDEVFSRFEVQPLAAATVGQVHAAVLRESGRAVVVKVLRPGLPARIREEFVALTRLTDDPGTQRLFAELEVALLDEADLRNEYANTRAGRAYDDRQISAVRVFDAYPASERVLVQERAKGRGIDRYGPEALAAVPLDPHRFARLKLDALTRLLGRWFECAMTGEGFFHADLHAGNIFLDVDANRGRAEVVLLDFGSAAFLTPKMRHAMLDLVVAIALGRVEHSVATIDGLAPIPEDRRGAFNEAVRAILRSKAHIVDKWKAVVLKAIDFGFDVPVQFKLFQRGRLMIEDQIERANRQLDLYDPDHEIPREKIEDIYARTLLGLLRRWDLGMRVHQKLQQFLGQKSL